MAVVFLLTQGGPFNSTHMLSSLAFQTGIRSGSTGSGAAISVFMVPILIVVTIAMLRFARKVDVGV
jgi:multiple sugar transport system permease protein